MKSLMPATLVGFAAVALFSAPAEAAPLALDQAPAAAAPVQAQDIDLLCTVGSANFGSTLNNGSPVLSLGSIAVGTGAAPSCPLFPVPPLNLGSAFIALA
ncbi:hypothetical protein [Nocardia stercoris]|uniref:DUF732 domain-containing protein n=1 Tax=Nocardia stercoris TaxID=2483361 RepID=A0A3M2LCL1_9NOCA|nr:hypothetical protein [Nocardia stercoris]RMI35232.1 hypothetical protein EBN03_02780 [Nocardia stercoris]